MQNFWIVYLTTILRAPDGLTRAQDGEVWTSGVARAYTALISTYEELQHVLELLETARTFSQARALLKLYIVAWISLSDLVANLANEVFDLGYAEQDIELGTILRNRKIRKTAMAAAIQRHAKDVNYDEYARRRNDVVHRGWLDDPELEGLRIEWLNMLAERGVAAGELPSDLNRFPDADDPSGLHEKIAAFLAAKRNALSDHLLATKSLLDDIGTAFTNHVRREAGT